MSRILRLACLAATLILLGACGSNVIDNTNPVDPLDNSNPSDPTGEISYSMDVAPIFSSSCSGAGCHVGSSASGVTLSTHSQVTSSTGLQYGSRVVVPGSASSSPLVDKISRSSPQFGSRMPQGRSPLSSSQIATISTWIDEGARNN